VGVSSSREYSFALDTSATDFPPGDTITSDAAKPTANVIVGLAVSGFSSMGAVRSRSGSRPNRSRNLIDPAAAATKATIVATAAPTRATRRFQ
jgi:hypothetical protein